MLVFVAGGCRRNPIERLTNPVPEGAVPQSSGTFVLYDDELKTGGGVGFIPGGQNQTIDFSDRSDPRRTTTQIRYTWSGQDVFSDQLTPPAYQHLFAGFSLTVPVDATTVASAAAKDFSGPAYTKVTLWVRGNLSDNNVLRIEGPDDGAGGNTAARTEISGSSLAAGWQKVTLPVPSQEFSNVKVFLTISIQYDQAPRTTLAGEGGTVFIDDIQYER